MPSSATSRNRFEKQGTGENPNTWGNRLNTTGLDLIDEALDGYESIALTGNLTLTSTNFASDQARKRMLRFTGSVPATVTIPAVSKLYLIWNDTSATLTITMGGSDTAVLAAGAREMVMCTGSGVYTETAAPLAAASAASAATSATNAAASAATASTAATSATSSASSASTSATNAANSASAAAGYAASLNSTNLVDRSTPQTIAGVKTFSNGIAINGQTIDTPTAFGVSVLEAADAAAASALLGGASFKLVGSSTSLTTGGIAYVEQTGLAAYAEVIVVFFGVSHNDVSSRAFQLQTSTNNGALYGTVVDLTPAYAPAANASGAVYLNLLPNATVGLSAGDGTFAAASSFAVPQSAKANAVRVFWAAGNFDNGNVYFYAR